MKNIKHLSISPNSQLFINSQINSILIKNGIKRQNHCNENLQAISGGNFDVDVVLEGLNELVEQSRRII